MTNLLKDYWDLRYKHSIDLSKSGLLGVGKSFNEWMYKVKAHVFKRVARRCLKKLPRGFDDTGRQVLDIGSGSGFYIDLWNEFEEVIVSGCDISDNCIRYLRDKYPSTAFHDIDISSFLISPGWWKQRFDIISCMDVLFHIKDDSKYLMALINIEKMLDNGGSLIFTENFVKQRIDTAPHITHRSEEEINHLFNEAGFHIVKRKPMLWLMNYPIDRDIDSLSMMIWNKISKICSISEHWSYIFGLLLYPLELLCVNLLKNSPTVEIAIAERRL